MRTARLEAFSHGVLAIIIAIMKLEMKVPHGEVLAALIPMAPAFLSQVLSFVYVSIYGNNRHNMLPCGGPLAANRRTPTWWVGKAGRLR